MVYCMNSIVFSSTNPIAYFSDDDHNEDPVFDEEREQTSVNTFGKED